MKGLNGTGVVVGFAMMLWGLILTFWVLARLGVYP